MKILNTKLDELSDVELNKINGGNDNWWNPFYWIGYVIGGATAPSPYDGDPYCDWDGGLNDNVPHY